MNQVMKALNDWRIGQDSVNGVIPFPEPNGEERVNDLSKCDCRKIKHIYVFDEDFATDGYELIDGQWVEKAVF